MSFIKMRSLLAAWGLLALLGAPACVAEVEDGDFYDEEENVATDTSELSGGTTTATGAFEAVGRVNATVNGDNKLCTGTLITEDAVLTAAHCLCDGHDDCVTRATFTFTNVRLPDNPATPFDESVIRTNVPVQADVSVHAYYTLFDDNDYDLAVLSLDQPYFAVTSGITPIRVQLSQPSAGQTITHVGYGFGNSSCDTGLGTKRSASRPIESVSGNQLRFDGFGIKYCGGDSGGPVLDSSNRLVGVASRRQWVPFDWTDVAIAAPPNSSWVGSRACAVPGDDTHPFFWSQCDDPLCPCDSGEGDCDTDAHCRGGLSCQHNVGAQHGLPSSADVCGCDDFNASSLDWSLCNSDCRCAEGEGDCDQDSDCAPGLVCGQDRGGDFGLPATFDVCVQPSGPPEPCPAGQVCCEPGLNNNCALCAPSYAYCP